MKLGAFLPPWGPQATPDDIDRALPAVEALGYDSVWVGDHIVFPRHVSSRYPYNATGDFPFDRDQPLLEPLTLLAYMAGRTTTIRLGVSVLVLPMRNPVVTAKALGDIDVLARGRLEVGVGVGWLREEFDALGADFDARGELTDEYVTTIRRLWSDGGTTGLAGRHHHVPALSMLPRPAHRIPILVGGNSVAAQRRAVRVGDGWNCVRLDPERVQARVTWLRDQLIRTGREADSFRVVLRTRVDATDELESYARAGVDELIVEVPEAGTGERLDRLAAVRHAWQRV